MKMSFWNTITSCFGSPSTPSADSDKMPRKSLESTTTTNPFSEKLPRTPSPRPESYLTPPVRSESQLMKHAKLPSSERTSKSLAEAAARPRAAIILTKQGLPQQENGEVDWMKIRFREDREKRGLEWNQDAEESYKQWNAIVARGRGCT
jgi:hypothetical protein